MKGLDHFSLFLKGENWTNSDGQHWKNASDKYCYYMDKVSEYCYKSL